MGYPMVKPHDPIVMSFDSVLKFQGTKVLHIEFSLHEAKSLELKVGVPTPCVVHQPVSRGFAVFADAWLSGWLAEISADLWEAVAH